MAISPDMAISGDMAISPEQPTIYLYSAHRAVIFAIAQLSCYVCVCFYAIAFV